MQDQKKNAPETFWVQTKFWSTNFGQKKILVKENLGLKEFGSKERNNVNKGG